MNILYIHSHDTGRIVEPYGYSVPTPNLMRLAHDSIMFGRLFSAAPTCSPSRAALLTGQYPHSCGQMGNAHRGFAMRRFDHHLVRYLASHGYATALAGEQHEAGGTHTPADLGYHEHIGQSREPEHAAAQWLASVHEPFFLSCGFIETHRPYPSLTDEERGAANGPGAATAPGYPDESVFREDFAAYRKAASALDRRIGVVLDALERAGLAESTIVLATTDHGISFPEMKCTLKDLGTGVMGLLRVPGRAARRIDALVATVDIYPTLCDLVGLDRPAWLEGSSLVPLLNGTVDSVRDEAFSEINFHAAAEPQRAVRTDRYKLIQRLDGRDHAVLPNTDDGPAKTELVRRGWSQQAIAPEQLYDLLLDPYERNNRIDDPSFATIRDDLRERLRRWMSETNDPALAGPIEPPAGAQLNSVDGDSPKDPTFTVPAG